MKLRRSFEITITPLRHKRETERDPNFYGGTATIHQSGELDVETRYGQVVAVWFRCRLVPFKQVEVTEARAAEMANAEAYTRGLSIEGITFKETD